MQALVRSPLSDGYADHDIETPPACSTIVLQIAAAALVADDGVAVGDEDIAAIIIASLAGIAVGGLNRPAFRGLRLPIFSPPRHP